MTEVIMPKMGDGMEEGTLLEWLKKDGDSVKSGEIIATIQTDKASLEMESPTTGTLTGFLINVGDTVPVGAPIAAVLKAGEALPSGWGGVSAPAADATASPAAKEPAAESVAEKTESPAAAKEPVAAAVGSSNGGSARVKASPLAKRVAGELGVDLTGVAGSGPGGRIVEKDVRSAPSKSSKAIAAKLTPGGADQVVPLNKIRQITAKRTAESKSTVPHFYVTVEVDLEAISQLRELFAADEDFKPSINDFVIKACASALREMPVVNASYQGDSILEYGAVSIGMAVALDDGLTLPVLHNADQMTIRDISNSSKDLAGRARDNRLSLEELSGSTFSISNMGMLNVTDFGAIINQPNAGIIAVSTARKMVVPTENDDEVEIRLRMNMTGSFDHRVVDGAVGAKFMNVVREYLEKPTRLLS